MLSSVYQIKLDYILDKKNDIALNDLIFFINPKKPLYGLVLNI